MSPLRTACLIAALAGLAGCGGDSAEPTTTTAAAKRQPLSPARRAALAKRRAAQRPHFAGPVEVSGSTDAERRRALVRAMRRSILRDARARAARKAIEGPILDVSCSVASDDRRSLRAHPDAPVVRYRCLAVNFRAKTSPPTLLGSPFVARVDFAGRRYAWCLFTPVGGEGTHTASTFDGPPSPACAER